MLENVLQKGENNKLAKELFSKILKLDVKELKFEKIINIDDVSDYKFGMAKLNATIEKDGNIGDTKVYTKVIRYDRIKEAIFCYWTLIYEEEFKNKSNVEMSNITKKVSIEELKLEEDHKKSVFLNIQNNNSEILQYGTELHFLDLQDYIREYSNDTNNLNKFNECFKLNNEEILLTSVIYTDKIHR